jgi:hypothetical protein
MKHLKAYLKTYRFVLLYSAIFWALSLWKGDVAALTITGIVWAYTITLWATSVSDATTAFDPYYLQIWVKPYEVLLDLGLIAPIDAKAYATIDAATRAMCERKKFVFNVLSPKLVHCSTEGQHSYFEVLNIYHKMVGVDVDWKDKLQPFEFYDGLIFFFRLAPERDKYEIGVEVPREWWNKHRLTGSVAPELKSVAARRDGVLILGTVPVNLPLDAENCLEHRYLEMSGRTLEQLNTPRSEWAYIAGYVPPTHRIKGAK